MMRIIKIRQLLPIAVGTALLLLVFPQFATRMNSLKYLTGMVTGGRQTLAGEVDGSIKRRATVMLAAARVAADYPLLGVGPGNFNFYSREYGKLGGFRVIEGDREAHCLYLEVAAEHGVIGLVCFLAILFVTLRNLVRVRRRWLHSRPEIANLATGFLLAIVAYLTTGIFLQLAFVRFFWLMLAFASSVGYIASRLATDEEPAGSATTPRLASGSSPPA